MSLTVNCPNCGAEVVFRSAALPSRVCDYCRTLLVRTDDGVGVAGQGAALPFDVSPVQIGMTGSDGKRAFEVIGRIRWSWTDGSWNEWLLLFPGGGYAWLGEAMGQFMLLEEQPISIIRGGGARELIKGKQAVPGWQMQIGKVDYVVSDAREVTVLAAEGELPFVPRPGWRLYSVDFRTRSGACASLQRDDENAWFYTGRYVQLSELAPRGLRRFEGWTLPAYAG